MALPIYIYAILVLAVALAVEKLIKSRKPLPSGYRRVPGPKGLPLIGNTLQMARNPRPQQQVRDWADQYGELFMIQMGYENWVFLNSPEAVKEILDKQSAITSSRVPSPVLMDLVSGGMRFLLMPYSAPWRKMRGIVHQLLTPRMSGTFVPSQEFEAKQLVFDCLTDNETGMDFYQHVRRYTTSVVMTSTYGRRIPKWDCDDIKQIYGVMEDFSKTSAPGYFLADTFPPLAKLPVFMQSWRKEAAVYYERQCNIWMHYWSTLSSQIATGDAPACFVKQFKDTGYEKMNISEMQGAFVAGTMIEAGSETTSAALNIALLHLAAFPQKARAAQEEIDRVVGPKRCPSFVDEDQLPYIRAIAKEVLRMFPTTTFGIPHYTDDDVKYKDFIIPKGTVVVINQQKLHYDPQRWENPFEFQPERFLSYPLKAGAYTAMADASKRDHFSFGAGRRICPGMHLAENSLFITLASLLWAFHILPPLDESGREVPVDTSEDAFLLGSGILAKPFRLRLLPRSEEIEGTIRSEWEMARKEGFVLGGNRVMVDGVFCVGCVM
ncbi:putative O-methylsterigmatocystin oxidoreductase [Tricharina praecox]|uniref:putative O-methylsterigmatocystin oxidoreductase n=1 Tax=Tricharina praecox TaxID=43433 RepID=UPI00221FD35C|nr:putative O-methylsterigmatocystin oxidoreductase [Tricharina praecox]KAI5843182.1 putative O-methylsterigmatocystin oxidoreductase [Tricharina praecox]